MENTKLKIMHVIWGLTAGGAERQLVTIATHQAKTHEVSVCCLERSGKLAAELESVGITVNVLKKKAGIDFSALKRLISILKKNKVDIVHSHIWGANFWARLAAFFARTPVRIIHEHSMFSAERFHRKIIDIFLAYFTDAAICVSSEILRYTISGSRILREKAVLVRNGIDISKFSEAASLRSMALEVREKKDLPPLVVIVGALEPRKDHMTFIKAASRLLEEGVDAEFQIIGDGPLWGNLEDLVKNLGKEKNIKFMGVRDDIADILSEAKIYVSSSMTEGISIALLEAVAVGVPVVATAVSGNTEVCGGENSSALLVPPEDSEALANAIKALLDCSGVGPVLAEKARIGLANRFDSSVMNRRIDRVYGSVLKREKQSAGKYFERFCRFLLSRIPIVHKLYRPLSLKAGEIIILTYHRVREGAGSDRLSVSTTEFARQMSVLERSHIPVHTLSDALLLQVEGNLPNGAFVLTFDDGYSDNFSEAMPVLNEFNYSATIFLTAGFIGTDKILDRYKDDEESRMLNWEECKALINAGWEIGSHTTTHAELSNPEDIDLNEEVEGSKNLLEGKLSIAINSFAYPSGKLSQAALTEVKGAGYLSAVTVFPGSNFSATDRHLLRRTEISGEDTVADFICKLKGGFDFYQKLKARNDSTSPERLT